MSFFAWLVIVVGVAGITAAGVARVRRGRALSEVGRRGQTWIEHPEDRAPDERVADVRDPPLPQRPLRGRANRD